MKLRLLIFFILFSVAAMPSVFSQPKGSKAKIVAHRGAWKEAGNPQNSIASLREAIRLGLYASECDVWMTSDGVLVVNHDKDFYGTVIETATYEELLKTKHPNGEKIPTLKEYLEEAGKQKKTRLILDIKPSKLSKERTLEIAEKCVAMVKETKTKKIVDYIHFDYDACKRIKQVDPKAEVSYLNGDVAPEQVQADGIDGIDYSLGAYRKNEGWNQDDKARKTVAHVWTVNTEKDMQYFIDQKVDLITTDQPELLLKVLAK